jgi:cytochrome c553
MAVAASGDVSMRVLIVGFTLVFFSIMAAAQAPSPKPAAPRRVSKPTGTLAQVMRGIYFPNANLIFDVQQNDPGVPKKKSGESTGSSTETYSGSYTGWEAVENAAVALTDGVDLILKPGRTCQNGKPVPLQRADFQKFARDMRQAGLVALEAARTKNQEKVSDATNNIAEACSNCHEVYRDKGPADSPARCTPPVK